MKLTFVFYVCAIPLLLSSCFKLRTGGDPVDPMSDVKVWGYKPVYGPEPAAKQILITTGAKPVVRAGNIYA